jgi:hypothetical protein
LEPKIKRWELHQSFNRSWLSTSAVHASSSAAAPAAPAHIEDVPQKMYIVEQYLSSNNSDRMSGHKWRCWESSTASKTKLAGHVWRGRDGEVRRGGECPRPRERIASVARRKKCVLIDPLNYCYLSTSLPQLENQLYSTLRLLKTI